MGTELLIMCVIKGSFNVVTHSPVLVSRVKKELYLSLRLLIPLGLGVHLIHFFNGHLSHS